MLFNSFAFFLGFLPVVLAGFHVTARTLGWRVALGWLVLASLVFYGFWYPPYLALILGSMAGNFIIGEWLRRTRSAGLLAIGVALNLLLLGVFKYAAFFLSAFFSLAGGEPYSVSLFLPLAISFFTFQQIAWLAECRSGRDTGHGDPLVYAFFITFFPQLIAGPIVRYGEIAPQIAKPRPAGLRMDDLAFGLCLFALGMAKKVLLADRLGLHADPVFADAAAGIEPSLIEAWAGSLAFTFQLYFDFSGYCDMALGLGRIFGIRLPENFTIPYRARDISAFWRSWHITLSRFLRQYLYVPLGGNKGGSRRSLALVLTMLLGGLWHGAGWTFVVWGGLHGLMLAFVHGWRSFLSSVRRGGRRPGPLRRFLAWALTFFCVHLGWVLFRAESFDAAMAIWRGLFGGNGARLPEYYLSMLRGLGPVLQGLGVVFRPLQDFRFSGVDELALLAVAALFALLGPTAVGLVARMERGDIRILRAGLPQGVMAGALLGVAFLALYAKPPQIFIYFQF